MSVEINVARRVSKLFNLEPPVFKLIDVVRKFADVEWENEIPLDIDGVCLNLKRPGTRPLIILSRGKSGNRQQFTLAHELGHVLIPTHLGGFIDSDISDEYSPMEAEANRFASELLLPAAWARQFLGTTDDPGKLVLTISNRAKVSLACAAYKLPEVLGPGFVFAEVMENNRVKSGISLAQGIFPPTRGTIIQDPERFYKTARNCWSLPRQDDGNTYWWWQFDDAAPLVKTIQTGADILGVMMEELKIPESDRRSLLGTIGGICNKTKRDSPVEDVIKQLKAAFIERATPRNYGRRVQSDRNIPYLQRLLNHALIDDYIRIKSQELIDKAYWLNN